MNAFVAHLDQTGIVFVLGLFSLFSTFLSGLCLLLYFRSSSLQKELWQELADLKQRIASLKNSTEASANRSSGKALDKTELKKRLKNLTGLEKQVSEKYRHVARLEQSGLGSQEIAEVLDVSPQEAEQMLSLAKASQGFKTQGQD